MIVLGIGEMAISDNFNEQIKTSALGASVALFVHDPMTKTVGLGYIILPSGRISRARSKDLSGHFADSAVSELFQRMKSAGSKTPFKHFEIKVIGGANISNLNEVFKIGQRNLLEVKKQLWKMGLYSTSEDVGGGTSRSVSVDVGTALVTVSAPGQGGWTI